VLDQGWILTIGEGRGDASNTGLYYLPHFSLRSLAQHGRGMDRDAKLRGGGPGTEHTAKGWAGIVEARNYPLAATKPRHTKAVVVLRKTEHVQALQRRQYVQLT
jgi:hypothetical protein